MKLKKMLKSPTPLFSLKSPLHSQRCCLPVTLQPQFLTKSLNLIQKKIVEKPLPSSQLRQPPPITEALPANVVGSPAKKKRLSSHYQWLSSQQHIKMPYNHHTT
jgi:hypothetical protein